jgi:trimethylamine--corrinoid protein Co-methyltransferase
MPNIQPIRSKLSLEVLSPDQVRAIQEASLHILSDIGIQFPSERALDVFAEHGADVDRTSQTVRMAPDFVMAAMRHAPRTYTLTGRAEGTDLVLDGTASYFCNDGCGVETVDWESGERRPSRKEDVAMMARVADYLSSLSFYWPIVSSQDYGPLSPLHDLDACFNNTVKHIQTETLLGHRFAEYAVRMAEVIAGSRERLRARPCLSALVCTIAPLGQDKEGIEGAMVLAEAGIPVGFMAMPNMGGTAPATPGGALALANAEVVSAMVLMQLVAPGAPVFHSILASVMDPRTADYISGHPIKYLCNVSAVQLAHDWGVPTLAGAFGLDCADPASWQLGRDSVYTALMVPLAGADMVVAHGLLRASMLLVPEQILFDDEIYHSHRILVEGIDTSPEGLALDVMAEVGARGHFLAQKHTRKHMRELWIPELTHPLPPADGSALPDIRERARARLDKILVGHHPDPLEPAAQKELQAILRAAEGEIGH